MFFKKFIKLKQIVRLSIYLRNFCLVFDVSKMIKTQNML